MALELRSLLCTFESYKKYRKISFYLLLTRALWNKKRFESYQRTFHIIHLCIATHLQEILLHVVDTTIFVVADSLLKTNDKNKVMRLYYGTLRPRPH